MKTNAQVLKAQARLGDRIIAHKCKQEAARGSRPKLHTYTSRINGDPSVVTHAKQPSAKREGAQAVAHHHHEDDFDSTPFYYPGGTYGPVLQITDEQRESMTTPSTRVRRIDSALTKSQRILLKKLRDGDR